MHTGLFLKAPNSIFTYPLYPVSLAYGLAARLWILSYRTGLRGRHSLEVPVISVGNIVAGGTGKTGFVIYLISLLREMGKGACVLTRGYGGSARGIVPAATDSLDWGDEVLLMRRHVGETPIVTGKDRVRTGMLAIARFHPDLLVLDDGFQYLKLRRDIDMLLIDATNPFGGQRFPPCGLLREPLSSVSRANMIVVTRVDQANGLKRLIAKLRRLNPRAGLVQALYKPLCLEDHVTKKVVGLEALRGKRVIAFCSIGNPLSFRKALRELGAVVVKSYIFSDHHLYRDGDLKALLRHRDSCSLVTTEKDAVKLPRDFPCLVLKVEMAVVSGEETVREYLRAVVQ